ncbi:MAG TPA: hypothetical protein VMZ92_14070, partial [Planctomycetota bacterium]|nr:hypothetical protein [Planctomycetota bacterium]
MANGTILFGSGKPRTNDSADPATLRPDVFALLRNVDPFYHGLRKRSGRLRLSTSAIAPANQAVSQVTSLVPYDLLVAGTRYSGILASDGRYFWTISYSAGVSQSNALCDAEGTKVDMGAGSVGSIWRGENHGAFCYLQNGEDKPQMLYFSSGLKMIQAGVEKPVLDGGETIASEADGAGYFSAGDIIYLRWAHKNVTTGVISNPSIVNSDPAGAGLYGGDSIGSISITIGAGHDNFRLSAVAESTQSGVDRLVIYRTRAQADAASDPEFWYDGEVTTNRSGDAVWDNADSGLHDESLTTSMWTDLENARVERDVPPVCTLLKSHGMRMWYAGAGTTVSPYTALPLNLVVFSDYDRPEYVAYVDQQTKHYDGTYIPTNGDVMAMIPSADRMLVLSKDVALQVTGVTPTFWAGMIGTNAGCIGNDAATSGDGIAYWASREGVYAYSGGQLIRLTHQILDTTYGNLRTAGLSGVIACYYPTKKQVWVSAQYGTATTNDVMLVYQVAGEDSGWVVYDGYRCKAMCCARTVHENTTTPYMYVVDGSNILYQCDVGDTDGADDVTGAMTSGTRSGTFTSSTGNTNITDSTASFYSGGSKLLGAPVWVYDADGGNVQLTYVTSNTGTALTVSPVMTGTPAAGWHYEVGGIGMRLVSAGVKKPVPDGYATIGAKSIALHIDRAVGGSTYSGSDTAYCYLLLDGATSIVTGDTKRTVALGDGTKILDFPAQDFGVADQREAGMAQVCIENYQTDRPILIRGIVFNYDAAGVYGSA